MCVVVGVVGGLMVCPAAFDLFYGGGKRTYLRSILKRNHMASFYIYPQGKMT